MNNKRIVLIGILLATFLFFNIPHAFAAKNSAKPIIVNNNASSVNTESVTLDLSGAKVVLRPSQMQFSNDNSKWSKPESYATTKVWTLKPGNGKKTVYVKYKSKLGKWSKAYSDTILLNISIPQVIISSPVLSATAIILPTKLSSNSADPAGQGLPVTNPVTSGSTASETGSGPNDVFYSILLDEHDTPLPGAPPSGWYFNCIGGDRGMLHAEDTSYTWDGDSKYTAQITHKNSGEYWTWGGMWYSMTRVDNDKIPVNFKKIFGPYVKDEYQGEITQLEIAVSNVTSQSHNSNLMLKIELKDELGHNPGDLYWAVPNLISQTHPRTYTIDVSSSVIQNVQQVVWLLDKAQVGDSISVDSIKLKARVQDLPTREQAFLWTYSWLMSNYDPVTGMVQDKSRDKKGSMESVTPTAKAAKVTYYAYKKGYITLSDAETIITKIADTLINNVPRGPSGTNALWPHFTKDGGTAAMPPHDGYDGTEWASGDTTYAALDVIAALQMIGDPENQIPALKGLLESINWTDLLSPDKYLYHGYLYNGTKIPYTWRGFGMETIGVSWAYASATGNIAEMQAPPSDNGSGFIDNILYPAVISGTDRWNNNWDSYRNSMADIQAEWYSPARKNNPYLYNAGLFGLSAAESAEMAFINPMYRLYNQSNKDHIYTTSETEISDLTAAGAGWVLEGMIGVVYPNPRPGTVPLYRLYSAAAKDHIYTINEAQKNNLVIAGWSYQGIACNVRSDQASDMLPVYSLFSAAGQDHIYTTSDTEKNDLVSAGWVNQGALFYIPSWYLGYGTGGKSSPVDGNNDFIALHYSGMISDIKPDKAIAMWNALRDRTPAFLNDRIILSPLNNMESMKVDKATGKIIVNHLKGSWNLALQAEGWAMADPLVKADLNAAVQNNAFLKKGYDLIKKLPLGWTKEPADVSASAGSTLTIDMKAEYPDKTSKIFYSLRYYLNGVWQPGLPQGATFNMVPAGPFAQFKWNIPANMNTQNVYEIEFLASDDLVNWPLTKKIKVTVTPSVVNLPPSINAIANLTKDEGQLVSFTVTATDPEGNMLTLTASPLVQGATFTDNGNGTGVYSWQTTYNNAGTYPVKFTVSDGKLTDEENIVITVNNVDRPLAWVIEPQDITIQAGNAITIDVKADDPDGALPRLFYSCNYYLNGVRQSGFPAGATLKMIFVGLKAQLSWSIPATIDTQANHALEFIVTDNLVGPAKLSKIITVTLLPVPHVMNYWSIIDDHNRPLPPSWYYNCTGGDRGNVNAADASYAWDGDSSYTLTITNSYGEWTSSGMWYSLIRADADNIPLDFKKIFGPYVKPEYQGKVVGMDIVVDNIASPGNNSDLSLKIEFKNKTGAAVYTKYFSGLTSYSYPKTFTVDLNPPDLGEVEVVTWALDYARVGDSITVDKLLLKTEVPDLTVASSEEQAFYWTYGWLSANYNPATGMCKDKSRDGKLPGGGDSMEGITATAKFAKITYYAYRKGYVTYEDAVSVITKIANTLLAKVPRGPSGVNTIWPHFTQNGGTAIVPNTEWASGDTIYAALDMIATLQMIGDPNSQEASFENFFNAINWSDLHLPSGAISHGYSYAGVKFDSGWDGFGMESVGANWAYASATGATKLTMSNPPSDNGSGFIDNACYPAVFSGVDGWGNDWDAYRNNTADTQISWYTNNYNQYLAGAGLFGLSAAETPEGNDYAAYGTGGKGSPNSGNGEVIALHYSGMISDIKPNEAIGMWETLRDRNAGFLQDNITVSPLNNLETMRVNKNTGKITTNYMKGSWNMALQAEGWAMMDPLVKADLNAAVQNNAFLKKGYDILKQPHTITGNIKVPQDYPTIQAAINAAKSGDVIAVAAGTYNETLTFNKSGVTLLGDSRNSIIQGVSSSAVISCSDISGTESVIKGFKITGGFYGIKCAGTVKSLKIDDNDIVHNTWEQSGFGVYLDDGASVSVENNYIGYSAKGVYAESNNNISITKNTFYYCRGASGAGIQLTKAIATIDYNAISQCWDGAINIYYNSTVTITGNIIKGNGSWNMSTAFNIFDSVATIRNNIISQNIVSSAGRSGGLGAGTSTINAFNNIFERNYSSNVFSGKDIFISDVNFIAKNNIFLGDAPGVDTPPTIYFMGTGTLDFSYNNMWNGTATPKTTGIVFGTGSIAANPLFVNTTGFALQASSPCVNTGDPATEFNDKNGTRNDMGIYGGPYSS